MFFLKITAKNKHVFSILLRSVFHYINTSFNFLRPNLKCLVFKINTIADERQYFTCIVIFSETGGVGEY